jgi:hypothetical protein
MDFIGLGIGTEELKQTAGIDGGVHYTAIITSQKLSCSAWMACRLMLHRTPCFIADDGSLSEERHLEGFKAKIVCIN